MGLDSVFHMESLKSLCTKVFGLNGTKKGPIDFNLFFLFERTLMVVMIQNSVNVLNAIC